MSSSTLTTSPPGRWHRLGYWLAAPFRFAYRRPGRFLAWLLVVLVLGGVLGYLGVQQWFAYHLKSARQAAEVWHNAVAAEHLQQCRRVDPEHREVLILTARIGRRTADWIAADAALNRYVERYGTDDALVFERLLHRAYRGEYDEIAPALQVHLAAGGLPQRLTREALINGLLSRYRYLAVQQVLGEWLQEYPDDPLAHLLKGKFLEGQTGFDEAVAAYRRALELDPQLLEARLRLATLYVMRRLGEQAYEQTKILREQLPDVAQVRVLWAKALALQGKSGEAMQELNACLEQFPNFAEALAERGAQRLVDGQEQAAVEDLERAVALDPGNIAARSQYALALARCNRQAESKQQYADVKQLQADVERTIEIARGPMQKNPRDPEILNELGMICVRAGQIPEAIRWFTTALEAEPNHLSTHQSLAQLYRQLDNPVLAAKHRAIAARIAAANPPKS